MVAGDLRARVRAFAGISAGASQLCPDGLWRHPAKSSASRGHYGFLSESADDFAEVPIVLDIDELWACDVVGFASHVDLY